MLVDLPYELLSDIVEGVVRDYLFEYFTSYNTPRPRNVISSLSGVSVVMRSLVRALLSSALAIPSLEDGRLSIDPFVAITLAQANSDARVSLACLRQENNYILSSFFEDRNDSEEHSGWKASPLLELYSVIRETRFKSDWILGHRQFAVQLHKVSMSPAVPMEKVSALKDKRLAWPALMEGGRLMACTSFIVQLARCKGSLRLFEPGFSFVYKKIDQELSQVEALERNCPLLPPNLRWLQIERQAIVNPLNIYISGIVPVLSDFLSNPAVTSDPRCEQWRRSGDLLLDAWAPLDNEIRRNPPLMAVRDVR